jgi:torulene dioxygenase
LSDSSSCFLQFQTLHEERTPVSLPITGTINSYCAGTLYRTGPSAYKASHGSSEFKVDHWFDGFGHTHRFEIIPGEDGTAKVMYNSRRANDGLIKTIEKSGKYGYTTFGQRRDPCVGVFGKVNFMLTFQYEEREGEEKNADILMDR